MTHTPGPWHTGTDEDAHVVYDARMEAVADTLRDDGDGETEAANALLVAAAPELLEALEECAERLHSYADHCNDVTAAGLYEEARKVIRKAKGGAPC